MKRLKQVLMVLSVFLLAECKKEEVNAALFITVIHNQNKQPVANPTVYLKSGGGHNPQIPLAQYDQQMQGDAAGTVLFTDLPEGDYYLWATVPTTGTLMAVGEVSVSMAKKEAPNRYEKKIFVQ